MDVVLALWVFYILFTKQFKSNNGKQQSSQRFRYIE